MIRKRTGAVGWLLVASCCLLLLLLPEALVAQVGRHGREEGVDNPEFFTALVAGDSETVKQFIDEGVDVNAFIWPVRALLLRLGFPLTEEEGYDPQPPLVWAFMGGIETTQLLLDAGAGINEPFYGVGWVPWHGALRGSPVFASVEIVRLLLQEGADLEVRNSIGQTPLMIAMGRNEEFEKVRFLVEAGADVNARDYQHWTTLLLVLDDAPRGSSYFRTVVVDDGLRLEMTRLL
ncbi:MAG: ankyrin repeat domain-containing protein, partial [Spirochaetia bacterium]